MGNMAGPDKERQREDMVRERALADRERAEINRQNRIERTRHDAIGVAQHILDPRVTHSEVIQPELIGFVAVAAEAGESLSPYESGPIRDALLIKAMAGDVEKVQVRLVEARNGVMERMMADPVLVSALEKYNKGYDPDIGDRPVEMTAAEWEAFGKYEAVRGERQALVDSMTNGVAGLYDDREDLDRRTIRLSARLDNLLSRQGTMTADEKKQYTELLAIMFGALKGPEATNYSRWAGMDRADLTVEEQVMLDDIWEKMMEALDGGEQGELDRLEKRKVRELGSSEEMLYERRRKRLVEAVGDADERDQLVRLLDRSFNKMPEEERTEAEARLELVAGDAQMSIGELKTFLGMKRRKEDAGRLKELREKKSKGGLSAGERGTFGELHEKAGSLTEAEEESIETIRGLIPDLGERKKDIERQIREKTAGLQVSKEWMDMAKAFSGMVSNINVTDQWRRAWHDLGAGAQDSFTQTRWAEYQRVSELVALMEMPGVGKAMQEAFRALCLIGLNRTDQVPGSTNVMQTDEKLTQAKIDGELIEPVRRYASGRLGGGADGLYVNFGVEMARMLFENGFCSAWFCVKRDSEGKIFYMWNGRESSDPTSEEYRYGSPNSKTWGDGTLYPDRQNDYVKPAATRAKQMKEWASGFETGLPALLPVLPDELAKPWITHEEMVAIANGTTTLVDVFRSRPENSRWGWAYGMFRAAQVYELVSKFVVGLKGFRDVAGEVDFFLRSPANLGALRKKIQVAFGKDGRREAQRFRMNMAMALIYAVYPQKANPLNKEETKTVLPDRSGGKSLTIINFEEDDIARIFVHRSGFLTLNQWQYIWKVRLARQINPGEGGKPGIGMIKKGEDLPIYTLADKDFEAEENRRRAALVNAV